MPDTRAGDGRVEASGGNDGARDAFQTDVSLDRAEAGDAGNDVVDAARTILCVRLRDPLRPNQITVLAEQVNQEYVLRVYRDCNVAKMARTDLDFIFEFYNDLLLFSLDLWGCSGRPTTTFGLVRSSVVTDLTSTDAARLVDHYVGAATTLLRLDTSEAAQLRQDLTRLGPLAITRQSEEFALSMCGSDGGTDSEAGSDAGTVPDANDQDASTAPDANDDRDAGMAPDAGDEAADDAGGPG